MAVMTNKSGDSSTVEEEKGHRGKSLNNPPVTACKADPPPTIKTGKNVIEMDIHGKKLLFWTPEGYKDSDVSTDPPQQRLKLEWVYGYRGNDCRSNIHVLTSTEVVYHIGTVAVMYNCKSHIQRHYREHSEEIRSLAIHPNGVTVATGQGVSDQKPAGQGQASVRVWRSDSLQTLHVFGANFFNKAVVGLGICRTKEQLCAIDGLGEDHVISVWDLGSGEIIASGQLNTDVICDIDFSASDPNVVVCVGKEHVGWYSVFAAEKKVELLHKGDYETNLKARFVIAMTHNEQGEFITGDSNGTIYVWAAGRNIINNYVKHGHEGPVFSLLTLRGVLLSGGRDGRICAWLWNKNMDKAGEIQVPKCEGGVRIMVSHGDLLLIGTTTNSILTVKLNGSQKAPLDGVIINSIALTQGHFDAAQGLAVPINQEQPHLVLTGGLDGVVCLFNTAARQPVWKALLKNTMILCMDVNQDATLVVLGTKETLVVLDVTITGGLPQTTESAVIKVTVCKVTAVKLSPDGAQIAAGDGDGVVSFIDWKEEEPGKWKWLLAAQVKLHRGAVNGMDWSADRFADSWILRTSSTVTEMLYWRGKTKDTVKKPEDMRNLKWRSHHCQLGYNVAGVYHSKQAREAEILSVDVNPQQTLVSMGDSNGIISVFRHPCSKQGAYSHTYRSHPRVRTIAFTHNGRKLISVGGPDSAVMQWHIS